MCIIVYNPAGKTLDKSAMRLAYDNNPHGFGVMWNEDHDVFSLKALGNFNDIWQLLKHLQGYPYALHFRWMTQGEIKEEQCHPFEILSQEEHGMNLQMMHNGTIFGLKKPADESDTAVFAKHLTQAYLTRHMNLPNLFSNMHGMIPSIGTFNKFVFMADGNRVEIVNEQAGDWQDNVWYSNTYSFEKGYRQKKAAASTLANQVKKKNKNKKHRTQVFYTRNGSKVEYG